MCNLTKNLSRESVFLIFIVLVITIPVFATDDALNDFSFVSSDIVHDEATEGIYVSIDDLDNVSQMNKSRFNETIEQALFNNYENKSSFEQDSVFLVYEVGNLTLFMNLSSHMVNALNDTFLLDADVVVKNNLNNSSDFRIDKNFINMLFQNISEDIMTYSIYFSENSSQKLVNQSSNLTIKVGPEAVYNFKLAVHLRQFIDNFKCKSITLRDLLPKDLITLSSEVSLDTIVRKECVFDIKLNYLNYAPFVKVNVSDLTDETVRTLVSLNKYLSSFDGSVITFSMRS